jgi:hypothetical protein
MRSVRIMFWVYMTFITAGLAFAIAVGLLGR